MLVSSPSVASNQSVLGSIPSRRIPHLVTISPLQHVAALGLVLADVLVRALRTRLLLPVTISRVLAVNTCGDAVAALTPGRVGGDPIRYFGYVRAGAPTPAILATFGIEIVADAVVLVAVGILLSILFPSAVREIVASSQRLLRSPHAWLVALVLALALASSVMLAHRLLPRGLSRLLVSLGEAWRHARARSPSVLAATTLLTLVSLIARGAVLPVLLATTPGLGAGTVILASALLVYGQTLAPTPAGAGVGELGFLLGLQRIPAGALPALILLWRTYTLALGVVAGTTLLLREGLPQRPRLGVR